VGPHRRRVRDLGGAVPSLHPLMRGYREADSWSTDAHKC
jgi:hypothetical protein